MNIKKEKLPNGLTVLSGGTRRVVCLSRVWQDKLEDLVRPNECPLHKNGLNGETERFPDTGWIATDNINTVHRFHKLILPTQCWPAKKLARLGGTEQIKHAFSIAATLAQRSKSKELLFLVQIGLHGGQSKGHLHYQLQSAERCNAWKGTATLLSALKGSKLVIGECGPWKAILGGKYAGQCFIVPPNACEPTPGMLETLSYLLSVILELYNRKFVSAEGLPPDFAIGFLFRKGKIVCGSYVPALYHQWGVRDKLADVFGLSVVVSWPHEVTYRHLFPS